MDENKKLYPMKMLPQEAGGAIYNIADLYVVDTIVDGGWLSSNSLSEIMETYLERVSGETAFHFYGTQFPVSIKTMDVKERTAIKVNVGDEDARQRYDSFGKTALWYIADAAPGSSVYIGLKEELAAEAFFRLSLEGGLFPYMREIHPQKGDSFLIRPGTIYAAGAGVKIVEVSEASELALDVWSPGGEAELEEAFDLIDMSAYTGGHGGHHHEGGDHHHEGHHHHDEAVQELAHEPQFVAGKVPLADAVHIYSGKFGSFILYHCLEGAASIQVPGEGDALEMFRLSKGDTVLVPAEVEDFFLVPAGTGTELLEVYMEKQEIEPEFDIFPEADEADDDFGGGHDGHSHDGHSHDCHEHGGHCHHDHSHGNLKN